MLDGRRQRRRAGRVPSVAVSRCSHADFQRGARACRVVLSGLVRHGNGLADYIGRYRAERIVGSGAFGSVWLALDEALGTWVAIKILAENWAHEEEIRRRFMEEARILWRADSEHIVRIHNVDQLPDGRPYFVMDYVDRGTLELRMRQRSAAGQPWSAREAIDIGLAIAEGLEVAHALGIVHRGA